MTKKDILIGLGVLAAMSAVAIVICKCKQKNTDKPVTENIESGEGTTYPKTTPTPTDNEIEAAKQNFLKAEASINDLLKNGNAGTPDNRTNEYQDLDIARYGYRLKLKEF